LGGIGPIQLLAIGMGPEAEYSGQVLAELERLEGKGVIRVLDLLFVAQDVEANELVVLSYQGEELGGLAAALLGFPLKGQPDERATVFDASPGTEFVGLTRRQLEELISTLPHEMAVGVLLVEHVWARDLKQSIRRAGAVPLVEGLLSAEVLADIERELQQAVRALDEVEREEPVMGAAGLRLEEPTHGGLVMARLAGERMRAGLADRTVDRTERRRALNRDAMTPEPGPASVGVTTSPSHPPTGARHHPVGVMCISTSPLTVASEA